MIQGENVVLRPLRIEDSEKMNIWVNDFDIKNSAMIHPFPISIELEKEFLENVVKNTDNKTIYFGIEEKESSKLVGYVKLYSINWIHRFCYFGIIIGDSAARGKRLGYEVVKLIINYVFKNLNLKRILLEVLSSNQPAINLYEKVGFEREGKLKQHAYIKGEYQDVLIFAMSNE